jgi:hypothetical protein
VVVVLCVDALQNLAGARAKGLVQMTSYHISSCNHYAAQVLPLLELC